MTLRLLPLLLGALVASCSRPPADQQSAGACRRVVAYSPALAKLMFELGVEDALVGISRWTVLPAGVHRPVVGDVQAVNVEAMLAVQPDCVFTQFSNPALVDSLRRLGQTRIQAFVLEQVEEVRAAAARIARLVGRPEAGRRALATFDARMAAVRSARLPARPRVLFVLGTDRPAVALGDSFLDDLIVAAGGVNAGRHIAVSGHWASAALEAIVAARPDVIVCQAASAGAEKAAREYWLRWRDIPAAATGRVVVVSDPEWTIPSLHLADQAEKLQKILAMPADPGHD